ncbi:MAG: hypothetical protein Q8Q62_09225 [Mesorhizobium sp.]|nr:hypothetical protein [Mesorhizobium sp.]
MKPTLFIRLIATLATLWLAAAPALADTILERRYTFDKLDAFWLATLESPPPSASWFDVLGGANAPAPVVPPPANVVSDLPFGGVIIGEDRTAGATAVRRGFPVIAIPLDIAPTLHKRLALLELYLVRYRYFERGDGNTAAQLDLLRRRQMSAAAELYLIGAMLYFAEPTLQAKCQRLERIVSVEKDSLTAAAAETMEPGWRPLMPVLATVRGRLDADRLRKMVCAIAPVRTRGEMQRIVTTRVGERVMQRVEAKVRDALSLLNAAGREFQGLVNDMDVEIKSAEILELERVLGNVESNLMLVKNDQLNAATTIAEIQAVDLSQLNQPSDLQEYKRAQEKLAAMVGEIDKVLEATARLSATTPDPAIQQELRVCESLGSLYDQLDLARDTASLEASVLVPYTNCLSAAETVVRRFQAPSLDQAFAAELSRHVRQLSEAFLVGGN